MKLFLSVKTSISVSPKETLLPRPKKLLNDLKTIIHGPESMGHPKGWGDFGVTFSQFSSVQFSRVWLFATPWITTCQASLSIANSRSSLKLMSIESVMPSSHLILCHPLLLLPLIPPTIRVFSNESTLCMTWPKYWSFSFSIIPSKELVHDKFKFCFLELSGFFFPNIFNLWFVESIDAEPVDMEGWLYIDGKEAY